MKLLYCKNCNSCFSLSEIAKKCDCGSSIGRIVSVLGNPTVYYSGDFAKPIYISDVNLDSDIDIEDRSAIRENIAKDHNLQNDKIFFTRVIEFLNDKAGTRHSTKFPSSSSTLVIARRDELKVPIDDFFRVITNKCIKWKGTDMEQYLRPKTLFNKTNFQNYIGEKDATARQSTGKSFDTLTDAAGQAKRNILGPGGGTSQR